MSGLFSTPKIDTPAPPTPAPAPSNSYNAMDSAAQQQALTLQRGRSSTILTGGLGVNDSGNTSRVLLGGR